MNNKILIEEREILSEKWVTSIISAYGHPNNTSFVSPTEDNMKYRLFDLASVTKIYSIICILSLHEKGSFDITRCVKDYTDNFPYISNLHIYELLNFSVELTTSSRIDKCNSFDEAVDLLHTIQIKDRRTIYSDMGIMVVVQLLNEINHSDTFFQNYTYEILRKINALNTFWWKDISPSETNIENYDSEYRYINDTLKEIKTPIRICHDQKARIIPYTGHAGLFSNAIDIAKFANAVISENIISKDSFSILLSDTYDSWDQTHHYGLLCNKKHPDMNCSEIPFACSDNSIAISGYTGTYLLLDFDNMFFVFIGANRLHNRITNLSHDSSSQIFPCTKDYVFRKDSLVRTIIKELIQ